ncbi:UNVERIFIED_CONTAM: hypothetical protein GTU68_051112 [Idotea baltica]|nr:hypothetical protein [Idotea baltica]
MADAFFTTPEIDNEPVYGYRKGSAERQELIQTIANFKSKKIKIPMTIGGRRIKGKTEISMHPPHELSHTLGYYYKGEKKHVEQAVSAALKAKHDWEMMPWEHRAAIFLKAADLLAGPYRQRMNAATMLCQSKNAFQAEVDAVAELCDFWRFNVAYMEQIYTNQPISAPGIWNRLEYRALEGFIFAVTPFNFTSIAANLPCAPALMGNTVVWKPAETQIYSANIIMEILEEAGLPAGVINLVFVDGPDAGDVVFNHRDFAGLHFTGSTGVFKNLWTTIGNNIDKYRTFPRIVGETGGKDFVVAHPSADVKAVATALSRGAFEFQGQKCSAASRAYLPKSLWSKIEKELRKDVDSFKVGSPEQFDNFVNAVIDERAYDKITGYIKKAKRDKGADVIMGGNFSKKDGYFIEPTVILAKKPLYRTMVEEIFGPVLTIYIYDDKKYEETLELIDKSTEYSLTGAVFAQDRNALVSTERILRNSAGNFYINDKPTGAVVGQQPFGGGRLSGTNDKAGSILNLFRWISPRTIKENFVPPTDYRYPFMEE